MNLDDINDSIECLKEAVASSLHINGVDWPGFADTLASGLGLRYERTGDGNDLDESLRIQRQAIDHKTVDDNHPNKTSMMNNLGELLFRSYQEAGEIEKLMDAIKYFRVAVELGETSGDGDCAEQLGRIYNVGAACYNMYLQTGSESSDWLKEATWNLKRATAMMKQNNPNKAMCLWMLGLINERKGDLDEAVGCFTQAFENSCALPMIRIWAARNALRIHQNKSSWNKAILLAEKAPKLLPLVCSRYISLRDQQYAIFQVSGFAADVASTFLMTGRPEDALQHLEFGRGLILSYLVDGNSDISNMKEDTGACGLFERYEELRSQLTQFTRDEKLPGRQDQLVNDIEACAADIRKQTKYKRFLLGPEIDEIKSAAPECPIIVVNTTNVASHAIIIWKGQVTSLCLQHLSIEAAPEYVRKRLSRYEDAARGDFHTNRGRDIHAVEDEDDDEFLSWLWKSCVRLVLEKLESMGLTLDGQHRVWWIGTGIAGSFPFHAAGMHSSQTNECTLMKVISSYATSIKTLTFSMSQKFEKTQIERPKRLLFVGMPTTPGGQRPLPGVIEEESVIRKACGNKYMFEIHRHPTVREILGRIPESHVIHFACHGSSNPAIPSESHLILQKRDEGGLVVDRLTVESLSKVKAKDNCFIAFLSACSTAEVKASSRLADEAIHLASILQAAGFAHTIGTLLPSTDEACVQVSKEFYRRLLDDKDGDLSNEKVARALHSAVRMLKSKAESRGTWMPFVHYGA